jgi:hypothetical protein
MIRLHVVAEGQTEERFVNQVLRPHLAASGVFADVRCVETSRDRRRHRIYRGGLLDYPRARADLARWMKQDDHPEVWFTTMFDLYSLPEGFPGFAEARAHVSPFERVETLEAFLLGDVEHPRFLPYLQLHEFEALVLVDAARLASQFLAHDAAIEDLVTLAGQHETPETIDDGAETAPSKRIIKVIPEYYDRKAQVGPAVAAAIGLPTLRARCPHFGRWLDRLESLSDLPGDAPG